MPCTCKVLQTIKSGWTDKSPPTQKVRKGLDFKTRWCTLGNIEICEECLRKVEMCKEGNSLLMLSYYKDDAEKKLQGRFNLEDCKVKQVFEIEERPQKKEKYILKLWLKHPERIQYFCFKTEQEIESWLVCLKKNIKKASENEEVVKDEESDEEEDVLLAIGSRTSLNRSFEDGERNTRISRELTLLKGLRLSYPNEDVSPLEEDFMFTSGETTPTRTSLDTATTGLPTSSRISQISNRSSGFVSDVSSRNGSEAASVQQQQRYSNTSFASSGGNSSRSSRDSGCLDQSYDKLE